MQCYCYLLAQNLHLNIYMITLFYLAFFLLRISKNIKTCSWVVLFYSKIFFLEQNIVEDLFPVLDKSKIYNQYKSNFFWGMFKNRNTGTGNKMRGVWGMGGMLYSGECCQTFWGMLPNVLGNVAKYSGECCKTFQGMS